MPHNTGKLLLSAWATSLAVIIVALFILAADGNAQETLQPYAPATLHTFLDSANVYPESVTVDQSGGTFFVVSVKEGTIYRGKIARPSLEVFSPGGADGRSIATGMFFANNRLVVVGRQTGLIFVYNTKNGSQFDTAGSPAAVTGTQPPVVPFWVTEIREDSDNDPPGVHLH